MAFVAGPVKVSIRRSPVKGEVRLLRRRLRGIINGEEGLI